MATASLFSYYTLTAFVWRYGVVSRLETVVWRQFVEPTPPLPRLLVLIYPRNFEGVTLISDVSLAEQASHTVKQRLDSTERIRKRQKVTTYEYCC